MLYVKIATDKGGSSLGMLEGIRRSMTRTDSTIIKIGGQGYIRQMSEEEHEKLVGAIESGIDNAFHAHSGLYDMTIDGTWSTR